VTGGLHIHRAERADPLVGALGGLLAAPLADPFAPEVVAVPSRGIERWLAQRLSHVLGAVDGDGVCANVLFPPAGQLLGDAISAADDAFAASVEQWTAERAVWPLLQLIEADPPAALAPHLVAHGSRRFAVAAKLARHYESYALARPAMLQAWGEGRDEHLPADLAWQATLWRALREQLGPSPAELLDDACAALAARPGQVQLPERFSIFGATRLAAARIAVLHALAAQHDVHLWLHHPSPALWSAVHDAAPGPGPRRSDTAHRAVRNPLLASLSRDVRELQQLLGTSEATDEHHPMDARPRTLLGRLQTALAEDDNPAPERVDPADRSITVHACHGPPRQVEVIREAVLQRLKDDPTLEPRDILIMCPDVEAFAPLVAAAFGMAEDADGHPAGLLRVRLADRSLRQTNPLLSLLAQLLELAGQRLTATQVLDLAGLGAVRARFGFADDDLEDVRNWATSANARWGLDAGHRAPYGLDNVAQGTWRTALDRLLVGVAMEEGETWLGPVLPLDDVDSAAIELAGRFAEFLDRLEAAVTAFDQTRTVPAWTRLLAETVLALGAPRQAWEEVQLRAELDDVAEAAGASGVQVTRADLALLLRPRLAGRPSRASFRTGTLTVCTLVPMRSVPHRVVCLVGMDDGAFPRHGVVDGDDVLARDPHTGERDVRSEDRQLFLDAICAAQEHLVITYTGADPRTGLEVPPCVPLGELLDAVDALVPERRGREHVVVHHPLQPFDARNFEAGRLGTDGPFSFDPDGLAGARATAEERQPLVPLVARPLPAVPPADVALDDLVRFLQHPIRGFLRQRLGISTWEDDTDPDDALPVGLDALQAWAVGERVLRSRLAGMTTEACVEIEHRRGELPPGQLGRRVLSDVGGAVDRLLEACATERAVPTRSVDVAVPLDDGRTLAGTVAGLRAGTLLSVTYSTLGARHRLAAWVNYLALVATGVDPVHSVAVGRGGDRVRRAVLRGIDPADARGILTGLVALRDTGLREPLPIAVKATEAYADRRHRGQDESDAHDAARRRWESGQYPGEDADPAHLLVLGGKVPFADFAALPAVDERWPETSRFGVLARRLWTPLLDVEVGQ
jgi:exodeoxyribonuclease V gamma subunit